MSDEQVVDTQQEVAVEAPVSSPEELSNQAAIARYRESQKPLQERTEGTPDGFNEDGTVKEDLIGGKFKSQEDLLTAYKELEKKLGTPKEEAQTEETLSPQEEALEDALEGFSAATYEQEFIEQGGLSDKSYSDLEAKGFSRQQVDAYIQGQQAYAASFRTTIYESVGGEEAYGELIHWASDNIDQDVIKEYNEAVNTLDQPRISRTLEYMNLKKQQSAPRETRRLEGDAPASGLQPFSNKNEWQRAMTDRLYGKDAKYTNMVDKRYLAARKKGNL